MGTIKWLRGIYGELYILRGPKYEYLGIDMDYSKPRKVKSSMEKYTHNVLTGFPEDLSKTAKSPVTEYPFTIHDEPHGELSPRNKPRYSTGWWPNQ